jgi:hypothetical protein
MFSKKVGKHLPDYTVTSQMTVIFILLMSIITKIVKLYLENLMHHIIGAVMCRNGSLNYVIITVWFEGY